MEKIYLNRIKGEPYSFEMISTCHAVLMSKRDGFQFRQDLFMFHWPKTSELCWVESYGPATVMAKYLIKYDTKNKEFTIPEPVDMYYHLI